MAEPPASGGDSILLHSARQLLTLRGPAGPRRGAEMQELAVIRDGAVLIRNGVIEDVGPTRRLANLIRARRARELDATGRVVLPAFVDPDAPLVIQALSTGQRERLEKNAASSDEGAIEAESLRVMSRKRMEMRSMSMAHTLASYGVLVTGSSTSSADDPRNVMRILTVQKALDSSPVRIRSILSWPSEGLGNATSSSEPISEWLHNIRARDLASIVEFSAAPGESAIVRPLAQVATQRGFAVRFRSHVALNRDAVDLAVASGAIAVHAPPHSPEPLLRQLAGRCMFVVPGADLIASDSNSADSVRRAMESGLAVALSSAFRSGISASLNMQFNLHLSCSRLKLSPEQAITAATHNAASALRFADIAGSLLPGRAADLIVMDVPDYRELVLRAGHHDILLVMRAGRVIYRKPALMLEGSGAPS